jgi:cell division protein FtsB
MKRAQKKQKHVLVIAALIGFFLLFSLAREYAANLQVKYELKELERQRNELLERNGASAELLESLTSEFYLEKQAREVYGLAAPGEKLIILTDDDDAEVDAPSISHISRPMRWFYYFFAPETFQQLQTYAEVSED